MQCTLNLTVGTFHAALADRIVFCLNLSDNAIFVLCASGALNDVSILQTNFFTRSHTEEFFRSIFHKVSTLYPEILRECDGVCAISFIFRIIDCFHFLCFTFRIVGNYEFYRIKYSTHTTCFLVQVFSNRCFE